MSAPLCSSWETAETQQTSQVTIQPELTNEILDREALKRLIIDLQALCGAAEDVNSVYRSLRPFWASHSALTLVKPAIALLRAVPSAESAVLHYTGMLTHEAAHLYLSKMENPHFQTEGQSVEISVQMIIAEIFRLIDANKSAKFANGYLVWSCTLLIDICKCNCERPIAKKVGTSSVSLLELFKSCPAVEHVKSLTDKVMDLLLRTSPRDCFDTLFEVSKCGLHFDWIWLHIAERFTESVVPRLLEMGCDDFKKFALSELKSEELIGLYNQKFVSLHEIVVFLVKKRKSDLRKAVRESLIRSIEEMGAVKDLEETLSMKTNLTTCFLLKLCANSSNSLEFLLNSTFDIITTHTILYTVLLLSRINPQYILPSTSGVECNYLSFFITILNHLKLDTRGIIYQMLAPFMYCSQHMNDLLLINKSLACSFETGISTILSATISTVLSDIHQKFTLVCKDFPPFDEYASDTSKMDELIERFLAASEEKFKVYLSFLNAFCMAYGSVRASEIIARCLVDAQNGDELLKLCALLVTLLPFSTNVAGEAMKSFFTNLTMINSERNKNKRMNIVNECSNDDHQLHRLELDDYSTIRWLENLRMLNEWEKQSDEKSPIKNVRFKMVTLYGEFMPNLLGWLLDAITRIEIAHRKLNHHDRFREAIDSVVWRSLSLCLSIGTPRILLTMFSYKLAAQFAALVTALLKNVGQESLPAACSLFINSCECAEVFLFSQVIFVRQQFITHLLDEALAYADLLFDCSRYDVWEYDRSHCGLKSFGDSEVSLLDQVRMMPLSTQTAVQVAHSGVIGSGKSKSRKTESMEPALFRRILFVGHIRNFLQISKSDPKIGLSHQLLKHLAIKITDRICNDGLTASFTWNEWDQDKEFISKYIAASGRLSKRPFIWDLMFIISDVYPCLWYCCPLLKAVLAAVLINFESDSNRDSLPSVVNINILDQWFFLLRKGRMLPSQMTFIIDLIKNVSVNEAFYVLLDVWRYFSCLFSTGNSFEIVVADAFDKAADGAVELIQTDISEFRSACRVVIQRNISTLGWCFPLIFSDELSL